MKLYKKIITLAFYGLLLFTFFLTLIADLISLPDAFNCFSEFDLLWFSFFSWLIELGITIFVLVLGSITLVATLTNKDTEGAKSLKNNVLIMCIYQGALALTALLSIFYLNSLSSILMNVNYSTPIVLIIFFIASIVLFILSLRKWGQQFINKIFQGIAYFLFFVSLCIMSSGGLTGITVAIRVFMFFALFAGAIHLLTYDVDVSKVIHSLADNTKQETVEVKVEEEQKDDVTRKLEKIKKLHDEGYITDEEYENKRKEIIDSL